MRRGNVEVPTEVPSTPSYPDYHFPFHRLESAPTRTIGLTFRREALLRAEVSHRTLICFRLKLGGKSINVQWA